MIKKLIITLSILGLFTNLSAQWSLNEEAIKYGNKYGNSLVVSIPYCEKKLVEEEWKKTLLKHYGKLSFKNISGGVAVQDAIIPEIDNAPIDLLFRILDSKTDTIRIATAFVLSNEVFIDHENQPEKFKTLSAIIRDYAYSLQRKCIELELQKTNKRALVLSEKWNDLQNHQTKLIKSNDLFAEKILKVEQDRNDYEKHIHTIEKQIASKNMSIKEETKANKKLLEFRKKLTSSDKAIIRYQENIADNKTTINEATYDMTQLKKELEEQEKIIQIIQNKLLTINKY